jgi:tight adherence protein B
LELKHWLLLILCVVFALLFSFALPGKFVVALFVATLFYLIIDLILGYILGDRGRVGQIKTHYEDIGRKDLSIMQEPITMDQEMAQEYKKHKAIGIGMAFGLGLISFLLFFQSILVTLFVFAFSFFYIPKMLRGKNERKRDKMVNIQFRDALNAIMASLKSGLSMNSAIIKVPEDLTKIHAIYKEKVILKEFMAMRDDLNMGVSLDTALISFRERLKSEEVDDFVNSVIILKRKGGNLVEVMQNTIGMISDKMALKAEIEIITAAKRGEAKVLTLMPIVVVVGLSLVMPNYIRPLFEGFGNVLSMIAFTFLVINHFVGEKITDIKA